MARGNGKKGPVQAGGPKVPEKFRRLLEEQRQRFPTLADIAAAAGLATSTVSEIIAGNRRPSPKATVFLAKALCPPGQSVASFARQLLEAARHSPEAVKKFLKPESVVERLRRDGKNAKIRVGVVYNWPFVFESAGQPDGFVIELLSCVARLIGAQPTYNKVFGFSDVVDALVGGEVDLIAAPVIPTFMRKAKMDFSEPFPFIRLALSALVSTKMQQRLGDRDELTVERLLSWDKETAKGLSDLRVMLVAGEAGEEFASTFLPGAKSRADRSGRPERTLDPEMLGAAFIAGNYDLLVADLATCQALHHWELREHPDEPRLQPLKEDPDDQTANVASALLDATERFPVLALYPVAFALPKGDDEWLGLVNRAMSSLLTDGLRPLLNLYSKYLRMQDHSIASFCIGDDENVRLEHSAKAFKALFAQYRDAAKAVERYRSPGLPEGHFRELGTLHLHVDGGRDPGVVTRVVKRLEQRGALGKVERVLDAVGGPQRETEAETYRNHTPGFLTQERFPCFSTSELFDRADAIKTVRAVLLEIADADGMVVEVERVVARMDKAGEWSPTNFDPARLNADVPRFEPKETVFPPGKTLPFEVHHGVNITVEGDVRPPTLEDLRSASKRLGLKFGGWFLFEKKRGALSYRSNAFFKEDELKSKVQDQHAKLKAHLEALGLKYDLWTVVEQVLGVWRTPIETVS